MNLPGNGTIPFFSYFCLDKGLIIIRLFILGRKMVAHLSAFLFLFNLYSIDLQFINRFYWFKFI